MANEARFKFPGSNGVIYPWSPRVGVNVKVLQRLEYALFQQLREAIDKGRLDLLPRPRSHVYRPSFLPFELSEF